MNTLGRRGIAIIGAVACLAVLVAGWFLLVAPVNSDISKTKAATAAQLSTNDGLQLTLASMRSIAKKLPQEKAELAALNQRIPDQTQLPDLLRAIQKAATRTGVTMSTLTPTQPTALVGAPGVSAIGINLSVSGGFAEVEQFDSALETLQRTFLVSAFSLAGGGAASSAAGATASASSGTSITAGFTGQVLVHTASGS